MKSPEEIPAAIFALLETRGPDKSICPSDVARALDPVGWRALMAPVRAVAAELQSRGELRVTQKDREVEARSARGPIRLRSPRRR